MGYPSPILYSPEAKKGVAVTLHQRELEKQKGREDSRPTKEKRRQEGGATLNFRLLTADLPISSGQVPVSATKQTRPRGLAALVLAES
jgi:hypothetical protein